jgi:hypothetical protein
MLVLDKFEGHLMLDSSSVIDAMNIDFAVIPRWMTYESFTD